MWRLPVTAKNITGLLLLTKKVEPDHECQGDLAEPSQIPAYAHVASTALAAWTTVALYFRNYVKRSSHRGYFPLALGYEERIFRGWATPEGLNRLASVSTPSGRSTYWNIIQLYMRRVLNIANFSSVPKECKTYKDINDGLLRLELW